MDHSDDKYTLGRNSWLGGQVSGLWSISLVLPAAPRSQSTATDQHLQPPRVSTCQVRGSEPHSSHLTIASGRSIASGPRSTATSCPGCRVFARWYLFHAPPLDVRRPTRSHLHETMQSWSNAADGVGALSNAVQPCLVIVSGCSRIPWAD
jgi:hypothetical protein